MLITDILKENTADAIVNMIIDLAAGQEALILMLVDLKCNGDVEKTKQAKIEWSTRLINERAKVLQTLQQRYHLNT